VVRLVTERDCEMLKMGRKDTRGSYLADRPASMIIIRE
jgi:hypothetical protein